MLAPSREAMAKIILDSLVFILCSSTSKKVRELSKNKRCRNRNLLGMIAGQQGAIAYGVAAGFSMFVFRLLVRLDESVDRSDDSAALAVGIDLPRPTTKE